MVGQQPRRRKQGLVQLGALNPALTHSGEGDAHPLPGNGAEPRTLSGSVELRHFTKRYGTETVVDSLNLAIAPGEFFSLLGPSGSGKTTTLMMIAGFAAIDAGTLLVDGRDLSGTPPERRGFGVVFQSYAIFPHLNVFENVAFPLRARGMAKPLIRERVEWALAMVQLGPLANRFARQLSGGQQQRVAIARAIVFHPSVVLMDEPLGALDKNLRFAMQTELRDIQQRLGMTVIYVTHDQEEAMNLSGRMAIMNRGRVEQVGPPRDVYDHPANAFAARFLGEANLIPGVLDAPGTLRLPNGLRLHAARPGQTVAGPAQLFVRPEKLAMTPAPAPAGNTLPAEVRRVSFLGNTIRTTLDAGGIELTVDTANHSGARHPASGAHVHVGWSPADSSILPADP